MNIPHIVKFSGGRSSGMMLMQLLEQKQLQPERGDVIVFNNTSAEHPATYAFTRQMKVLAEQKYNIPFFWIEYQTYEDAGKQTWKRIPSYRLVNEKPFDGGKNKNGYRYKGEVFEEMVSFSGFLPNMLSRTCTQALKIFTTNSFLTDWLAQKESIERLGHYGETTRISDADVIKLHRTHRGTTPDEILLAKKEFVRSTDFVRHQAAWKSFTGGDLCFNNQAIQKPVIGGKAQLFGDGAVAFVSYIGIRKDEEIRVDKIKARIIHAQKQSSNSTSLFEQPVKESIFTPLVDNHVSKQNVIDFWKNQTFDLDLPEDGVFSNCVYCPLKGKAKLLGITQKELSNHKKTGNTAASIDWWIKMEKKYSRDLKAENREITNKDVNFIGFFGAAKKTVYEEIKKQATLKNLDIESNIAAEYLENESHIPCNCTD